MNIVKLDLSKYTESSAVARDAGLPIVADFIFICNELFDRRIADKAPLGADPYSLTLDLLKAFIENAKHAPEEATTMTFIHSSWKTDERSRSGVSPVKWTCLVTAAEVNGKRILIFSEVEGGNKNGA